MITLSLVLATCGRSEEVGRCLRSLASQSDQSFEVLVVDQNKDDRLLPIIKQEIASGLMLRHLRMNEQNLSHARNFGIAQSVGEIIGFPDDDCWYDPDTVESIRCSFLNNIDLQGAIACWVEQAQGQRMPMATGSLSLQSWRRFRGGDASSISLFLRKDLLKLLGGFDERLGVGRWYGAAEETDLVLRALATGARLDYCPQAKVHHAFAATPNGNWRALCQNARNRARGTGAIYAKHRLSPIIILRGCTAPLLVSFMKYPVFLSLVRGGSTVIGRVEGLLRWGWGRP